MIGLSLLPAALLIGGLVILLWFALGTRTNIERGNRTLRWLQDGLPLLGRRTTMRWLGSSAVQLGIRDARAPFREAEVVVVLEPRDVSVLWAWARTRHRRDFLILRGELVHAPDFELEAGDARGWTGRDRVRRAGDGGWGQADWGDEHVVVRHTPDADQELAGWFWGRLGEASGGVWRLSIRKEPPHVEIHVRPPDPDAIRAGQLFSAFRELGQRLAD
jgi:hypothetical protein